MGRRLEAIQEWETLAKQADYQPGNMAALCPISLRQLERFFAEKFHQTPGEWVRLLRCRLALQLISEGYSTKAAAAELRFASESHFCHEFKKTYGVSPQSSSEPISTVGKAIQFTYATTDRPSEAGLYDRRSSKDNETQQDNALESSQERETETLSVGREKSPLYAASAKRLPKPRARDGHAATSRKT